MVNLTPWSRRRGEFGEFGSLLGLRNEMDRLFDRFFESPMAGSDAPATGAAGQMMQMWSPALEMYQEGDNLIVSAEVPGMNPDDIEINVSGNELTISGEKREETEQKHEGFYRSERRYGRFHRSIELPSDIDSENASAEYVHGVLKLTIPRTEQRRPRKIQVNAGSQSQGKSRESRSQGDHGRTNSARAIGTAGGASPSGDGAERSGNRERTGKSESGR